VMKPVNHKISPILNRLLKKSQVSARQGKNRRKSAVYTQYMSILSLFLTLDRAA
jgi:hypothetical protein